MQKTNFKTRLLALLTAVFMVIVCVPFAAFADNTVTVGVRFIDKDTTEWLNQDLVNVEASQSEAENGKITIPADKVPQNYVIDSQVVFNNNGKWLASVYLVKKPAAPAEQTVTVGVRFIDKDTTEWLNQDLVNVEASQSEAENGKITIPADKVPQNYVIDSQVVFNNNGKWLASVYLVKKPAAPAKKTVHVHFFSDANTEIGSADINVNADATSITIMDNMIPAGYALDRDSNVVEITKDQTQVSLFVSPVATPTKVTITVNMFDEANGVNGKPVKTYTVSADKDATSITVDKAQIPTGYVKADNETYEKNVFGSKDEHVAFWIKKDAAPAKKTVHVHFFSDAVTEIGSVDINVNADATSITILDNMIPEGYALDRGSNVVEITKDQTQVSLFVSPVATPTKVTITVNMFDEANGVNGKPVKTYTVSADKDATSITVDKAQIPTGYVKADNETYEKNVIGGKDDYVAFWIKKDAKAPEVADIHVYIKSSNNDLGTVTEKNIMLTKSELTGEYKAFALKATAKNGYHLTGWTVTADGKNVATVKADAATVDLSAYAEAKEIVVSANFEKNASTSASSTASSSSNKTTTASNEKQVVKAAAAPANTTKVLPKTGASNVAPLLGGSLAVVALLMGYGVYSLVLRKKD